MDHSCCWPPGSGKLVVKAVHTVHEPQKRYICARLTRLMPQPGVPGEYFCHEGHSTLWLLFGSEGVEGAFCSRKYRKYSFGRPRHPPEEFVSAFQITCILSCDLKPTCDIHDDFSGHARACIWQRRAGQSCQPGQDVALGRAASAQEVNVEIGRASMASMFYQWNEWHETLQTSMERLRSCPCLFQRP